MFVRWYVIDMPTVFIQLLGQYVSTLAEVFSFLFLLRTFLSPWKQIVDRYPSKGLDLGRIAQTFTLNCTARVIGALFRLLTIMIGLAFVAFTVGVMLSILFLWFALPVLVPFGIFLLLGVSF